MREEEIMGKKKQWFTFLFFGLVLAVLVEVLFFLPDRRGAKEAGAGEKEEDAGNGTWAAFGSSSVVISPSLSDGMPCDFSLELPPAAMVPLADRLLPELNRQEQVAEAAAFYWISTGNVYHGVDGLQTGRVLGVGTGFLSASGFQVEKGRGLTERDLDEKKRTALLDGRASQALFPGADPVGETIEVESRLYQVVGVIGLSEPQTGGGLVLIPESTWPEVYQYEEPKSVVLRLSEPPEELSEEEWKTKREEAAIRAARTLNSMLPESEEPRYRVQE